MSVSFFDSNPGIVDELRAMDHDTREYKKQLRKVLMEIGGVGVVFSHLKTSDEGNRIRRKYFHQLIAAGAFLVGMFIWIVVAVVLTGGKEIDRFSDADAAFFIGFIVMEIASITLSMLFAFRCNRLLLQGVSFLIDHYRQEDSIAGGNTLGNYKFEKSKVNKIAMVVMVLSFILIYGIIKFGDGTIDRLLASNPQEFSKAGLTITLTQDFHEMEVVSQTATYFTPECVVTSLKEEFTLFEQNDLPTDISLKEYAEIIISNNALDTKIEGNESRPCFVYGRQANGKDYTYLATVFKGSDAFWMVTFACESKNYASSQEQFIEWADTITTE